MTLEVRPYQQAARVAIHAEWAAGNRKTLLVLPTGTGKTVVFAKVIEDVVREGGRALILAHRGELLDQAAERLYHATGLMAAVEKAEDTSMGRLERVVVGSVQTMMRDKRLAQFNPAAFDCIVVDEAHHVLADSYQAVLSHFPDARVLGVTATADRGDKRNLGLYFDSLAYEYTLPAAIKDGWLCRIEAQTIPLQLDISKVGVSQGDYKVAELGTALDPYLDAIADEMVAAGCLSRKVLVFLPLIRTSQKFAEILASRGFAVAEVNGDSYDRADTLARFASNEVRALCNSMLLTEGYDCPDIDCIVVLRPTKVRSLYSQMVGRGTRIAPDKDALLVLDFLWHTERHELVHPAHLVCDSEEVAAQMTKNLESAGCPVDIEVAEVQATDDVVRAREEALAKTLEEMRKKKAKLVDPIQYAMSIAAEDLSGYVPTFPWEMMPASDTQIKLLEKKGIAADSVGNAGLASLLIDRLAMRQAAGLATPKQIRFLEGKGFKQVGTWSSAEASNMVSRIEAAGWIVPRGIKPAEYVPEGGSYYA